MLLTAIERWENFNRLYRDRLKDLQSRSAAASSPIGASLTNLKIVIYRKLIDYGLYDKLHIHKHMPWLHIDFIIERI